MCHLVGQQPQHDCLPVMLSWILVVACWLLLATQAAAYKLPLELPPPISCSRLTGHFHYLPISHFIGLCQSSQSIAPCSRVPGALSVASLTHSRVQPTGVHLCSRMYLPSRAVEQRGSRAAG